MKSQKRGKITSPDVEVLNISSQGVWLYVLGDEHFLPYDEYPWFAKATVQDICTVRLSPGRYGLHWPKLDVDLSIEGLRVPEKYPLRSKAVKKKRKKAAD